MGDRPMCLRPPQGEPWVHTEERVMEMEWTQEAIQAEVDRRHEVAQHSALVRQLRESRHGSRPSWWRRFRSHHGPTDDQNDGEPHAPGGVRACLTGRVLDRGSPWWPAVG